MYIEISDSGRPRVVYESTDPPAIPLSVSASIVDRTHIKISWNGNSEDKRRILYQVYARKLPAPFSEIKETTSTWTGSGSGFNPSTGAPFSTTPNWKNTTNFVHVVQPGLATYEYYVSAR